MLVGVVSDTHGDCYNTRQAVRLLESLGVSLVIHCGDVGAAGVVELFSQWPVHFVLGNVDDAAAIATAIGGAGQTCHGRFGSLELEGRKIAVLHGDDRRRLRQTIAEGRWDMVCHGHTHEPSISREGPTLVVNPGAVSRTASPAVAVVELSSLRVTPVSF
jgi:hypothetical protein